MKIKFLISLPLVLVLSISTLPLTYAASQGTITKAAKVRDAELSAAKAVLVSAREEIAQKAKIQLQAANDLPDSTSKRTARNATYQERSLSYKAINLTYKKKLKTIYAKYRKAVTA